MKGLAAAGQAVVDEAVKAAEGTKKSELPEEPKPTTASEIRSISP
jgi:hypothetical protein